MALVQSTVSSPVAVQPVLKVKEEEKPIKEHHQLNTI